MMRGVRPSPQELAAKPRRVKPIWTRLVRLVLIGAKDGESPIRISGRIARELRRTQAADQAGCAGRDCFKPAAQ